MMQTQTIRVGIGAIFAVGISWVTAAADEPAAWNLEAAARYLDERAATWFDYTRADRGQDSTQTSCLCCHTIVPYAMVRPVLRQLRSEAAPAPPEARLVAQTQLRVKNWNELDTPAFRLLYDFSDTKKSESRGTEAVLNALILATDDAAHGRSSPSDDTKQSLAHVWQAQATEGEQAGSWDWLNFALEPWESSGARYFGATLAAIAVGTAPGGPNSDTAPEATHGLELLKAYLQDHFEVQSAFNRAHALWAAGKIDGLLTDAQREQAVADLRASQEPDGGWRLAALGGYQRTDKTPQQEGSDAYATGLVVYALRSAGVAADDLAVAKGAEWLRTHQSPTGQWSASSVNKTRDPATHIGKFMSDAATAQAVMALGFH